MDIREAIQHCREVAAGATAQGKCPECAAEHEQLAEWLEELAAYKDTGLTQDNGDIPPYVLLGFWNPDNPGWDLYGVTHWRPLPDPPKEA